MAPMNRKDENVNLSWQLLMDIKVKINCNRQIQVHRHTYNFLNLFTTALAINGFK